MCMKNTVAVKNLILVNKFVPPVTSGGFVIYKYNINIDKMAFF